MRRALFMVVLFVAFSVPAVGAGVVLVSALDEVLGTGAWSADAIRGAVREVAGRPLALVCTRPVTTTFVPIAVEEDERPAGLVLEPVARPGDDPVLAYFTRPPRTPGQHDAVAALTEWRRARVLKFELCLERVLGKRLSALVDADVATLRADPTLLAILADIFEPVPLVRPAVPFGSGPACGHIPSLHELPGREPGGAYRAARCDALIILEDAKIGDKTLALGDLIANDLLGDVIAHEACHGIMGDLMGKDSAVGGSTSFQGHDTPVVTDRRLAFSEGFAEAFEAWAGRDNPAVARDADPESFVNLLWARQEAVRRNRYVQAGYQRFRHTRATGELKSGAQLAASEGAVAGLIHTLVTHRKNRAGWELVHRSLYLDRPADAVALVASMARRAPDEATRAALLRAFLWTTRFSTVSGEAIELYAAGAERFEEFVRPLEAEVLAGRLALDAALGPEIWLDGVTRSGVWRYDLNAATDKQLATMGLSQEARDAVLARRAQSAFRNLDELARLVPEADFQVLKAAQTAFRSGVVAFLRPHTTALD